MHGLCVSERSEVCMCMCVYLCEREMGCVHVCLFVSEVRCLCVRYVYMSVCVCQK